MLQVLRRYTFIIAVLVFFFVSYLLYSSLETASQRRKELFDHGKQSVGRLEKKLADLENELQQNENLIGEIRGRIYAAVGKKPNLGQNAAVGAPQQSGGQKSPETGRMSPAAGGNVSVQLSGGSCSAISAMQQPHSDVQMLDAYESMSFENPDGGVWKQGWPITYDEATVEGNQPQLQVFVIPHSHCDPGWIKTFEDYYTQQVKKILDNMVIFLSGQPKMKFIYAEISFFERWWRDLDDVKRNAVRKLTENGQLEIVTGAWVMTDEANAHYYSMMDQMIEGHEWLQQQLNYRPKHHWSIDPFGLSATMAYLVGRANFSAMALQRVHYAVKKRLARERELEFYWRQLWAGSTQSTDILAHVFPFYSYDVPHTCGPEPAVCCQFDFKRLPGGGVSCPWNKPPVAINDNNVAARSALLLDQWRKKAELYRSRVLLIPLGDDFRYDTADEWQRQYENYNQLFEHMNANGKWNVKAQFGTLSDYFAALQSAQPSLDVKYKQGQGGGGPSEGRLPVLTGDFFTYADRDDHYWSGYYTSRPFYKRMERVLMHYLRSTELMYSWTVSLLVRHANTGVDFEKLYGRLVDARRQLAIFQHHDGITGTAKDAVVSDYGFRLKRALESCQAILSQCAHFLLTPDKANFKQPSSSTPLLDVDETRAAHDSLPTNNVFRVTEKPRVIIVYNALESERESVVCVRVDRLGVRMLDAGGQPVRLQLEPVLQSAGGTLAVIHNQFKACFVARIPAVGMARFELSATDKESEAAAASKASVRANYNVATTLVTGNDFEQQPLPDQLFSVDTDDLNVTFSSKTGYMKTIVDRAQQTSHSVQLEFVRYGARRRGQGGVKGGDSLSGAYLFLPDGQAKTMTSAIKGHPVVVVRGELSTTVYVQLSTVLHTVTLYRRLQSHDAQVLHIHNTVDVSQEQNYELAMRIKTEIDSKDIFYTDLNGLQMLKRKRFGKLPLQAHFYPMPAAAYIEDGRSRLSLLSAQPLGVSSQDSGWLEVILDRRLIQDDDRGLFQGVTDNKVTPDVFRLSIESMSSRTEHASAKTGFLTLLASQAYRALVHPPIVLYSREVHDVPELLPSTSLFAPAYVPACDVHVVNLRCATGASNYGAQSVSVQPKPEHALVLHRTALACHSKTRTRVNCAESDEFSLSSIAAVTPRVVEETSLTLLNTVTKWDTAEPQQSIRLQPMDLRTFRLHLA